MKSWDIFKVLLSEVSLRKRKLVIFVAFLTVVLGLGFFWQKSRHNVEAAVLWDTPTSGYSTEVTMDVVVSADAQVYINGQKDTDTLKFYQNFDEVKIIVFSAPGYFVQNFRAVVHLPSADGQNVRPLIYAVHGVGSNRSYLLDSQTVVYEVSDISPQAEVTIAADLPKSMVSPGLMQRISFALSELPVKAWLYVAIVLPLLATILMTFMIVKRRSAQVFFVGEALSVPPSKEPPAMVGALLTGAVGAREIAATLIDLSRRGYILIVNKGNGEFCFGQKCNGNFKDDPSLRDFERVLLDKIFLPRAYKSTLDDVEMRVGRHIFSRKIAQFYLGAYNFATKRGYFIKNPVKVHLVYKYLGIALLFLSLLGFAFGAITEADPKFGLIFWVGGMLAAYFMIKLSPFMPARSKKGTEELRKWLAFRKYLRAQKSLKAGEVLESKFEEYLPLAIVLGSEVEWAKRFIDEPFTKPAWYESAESTVVLESFVGEFFPFLGFVAKNLAKSHEPTVE